MQTSPALSPSSIIWRSAASPQDVMRIRMLMRAIDLFTDVQVNHGCTLIQQKLDNPTAPHHFLFALEQYSLVGNACFSPIAFTDRRWELQWIATHPDFLHTGIAGDMLTRTEDFIRAQGGVKLYAYSPSRAPFAPAREFFTHHGFTQETVLPNYFAEGDDRVVFGKAL